MPKELKFTKEKLDSIPELIAKGQSDEQIAAALGTTVASLKATCCKKRISLRRPNHPKVYREKSGPKTFATNIANVQFKCKTNRDTMMGLALYAQKRGMTAADIIEQVIAVVVRDDLFDRLIKRPNGAVNGASPQPGGLNGSVP